MKYEMLAHVMFCITTPIGVLLGIQAAQKACKQNDWEPSFRRSDSLARMFIVTYRECVMYWNLKSYMLMIAFLIMMVVLPYTDDTVYRIKFGIATLMHTVFYIATSFAVYEFAVYIRRTFLQCSPPPKR